MDEICAKEICTGCKACANRCPQKCISFKENIFGHIYPEIDLQSCINCKLCKKVCPALHPVKLHTSPNSVLAAWVKDDEQRVASTSGGISYILSRQIVSCGGVYYGVDWDPDTQDVAHFRCDDINNLSRFQGSKYGHSDTRNTYQEVLIDLKEGRNVLYSGTPCQIAGLKSFLGQPYDNLYTIDLLCHGVPSKKVFRDRIQEIERASEHRVIRYISRVKTPDQYFTSSEYSLDNGDVVKESFYKDYFARFFVQNFGLRPNCYECRYAGPNRIGDITVADFWGYTPQRLRFRSYRKGTSLLLVNNPKGQQLISDIQPLILKETRTMKEAASANHNLIAPQPQPRDYEEFWNRYLAGDSISLLADEYFPSKEIHFTLKHKVKIWIKMLFPDWVITLLAKHK